MRATPASAFNRCVSSLTSVDFALLPDTARVNPFGAFPEIRIKRFQGWPAARGICLLCPILGKTRRGDREKGENWPLNKGACGRAGCMRNAYRLRLRLRSITVISRDKIRNGQMQFEHNASRNKDSRSLSVHRDAASWRWRSSNDAISLGCPTWGGKGHPPRPHTRDNRKSIHTSMSSA